MANERKTENIVRKHFEKYTDILIEEQKSDDPKIIKLLKSASKKGTGSGNPEFIITYKNNSDFLVVVECKSDIKKHESKTKDKYSEFAVDGSLLYASYLSKEFDVLAIAVSGEKIKDLRISHNLFLKGQQAPITIFGDKLLDPNDYLQGYLGSPEKFRQDYESLISFSKNLNEQLHAKKVKESQRSLLISGILIALENDAFQASYKKHKKPKDLANNLVQTIINELKNANLNSDKLDNLITAYSFIKTHTSLSSEPKVLSSLIENIDKNVNKFIKTHQYFDVLGQFYIEFLKYANSDRGLGIVLTPPHITEMFSLIAGVNKDSVVYDNCTGTGGFLISAMQIMIQDSKGDSTKISTIKEKQLIGVEWQDDVFALACSNMFIHKDGKTNIFHGSCFDPKIIAAVKKQKPTIGFLNPPYKTKKSDTEELEYVINNLEVLEPNGVCLAIIPASCVLAQKGASYELKKKLLSSHTLEAVFSMPDELFFNSDVGIITVVIVLTAHKPHPPNKETYFGYWKDDGFVKRKTKGRIDLYGKWNGIKEKWFSSYINRRTEPGFSVNKAVTADDEWCAEAYLETNYNTLSEDEFLYSIKKYILYKKLNGINE